MKERARGVVADSNHIICTLKRESSRCLNDSCNSSHHYCILNRGSKRHICQHRRNYNSEDCDIDCLKTVSSWQEQEISKWAQKGRHHLHDSNRGKVKFKIMWLVEAADVLVIASTDVS